MLMLDYWREALKAALDDVDAVGVLTPEQIDGAAKVLLGARETESQWDGSDCIPNPEIAEVRRMKEAHATQVKALEAEAAAFRNAYRSHVGGDRVHVGFCYGEIRVWPR